jgi:uncharacterized protein
MKKKILITGATGLIGKQICRRLIDRGDEVTVFTRSVRKAKQELISVKAVKWDYHYPEQWGEYLEGMDCVIHLAGVNLFSQRWTDEFKNKIMESRKVSTSNLAKVINSLQKRPESFITASAIGYYGNAGNLEIHELTPSGDDFLAVVTKEWENSAAIVESSGVRRVSMRTGVVLSPEEGALKQMLLPFKLFVGGPLGKGKQWFSWIHLSDVADGYIFAIDNRDITGPVNLASPNPVRMNEFAETLGDVLNRPSFFKVPGFALKIAVGEAGEVITYSQKVIPEKLLRCGYRFNFINLRDALNDLLKTKG